MYISSNWCKGTSFLIGINGWKIMVEYTDTAFDEQRFLPKQLQMAYQCAAQSVDVIDTLAALFHAPKHFRLDVVSNNKEDYPETSGELLFRYYLDGDIKSHSAINTIQFFQDIHMKKWTEYLDPKQISLEVILNSKELFLPLKDRTIGLRESYTHLAAAQ